LVSKDGYISISFSINVDTDTEPYNTYHIELQQKQQPVTDNPLFQPGQQTENPPDTVIPTPAQPDYQQNPFDIPNTVDPGNDNQGQRYNGGRRRHG